MTKWNAVPAVLALGLFVAAPAQAQMNFGVQGSWGSDSDLGVGFRFEVPIGARVTQDATSILAGLKLIGSADYFFWDCDPGFGGDVNCSWVDLNLNGAVPVAIDGFSPYFGAGLNVALLGVEVEGTTFDESETEIGINLLGGLQFPLGGLNTFAEGRVVLSGVEQFVVTFGVLF